MLLISETFFYSGSLCQEEGSEESRVLISGGDEATEDCSECSSESGKVRVTKCMSPLLIVPDWVR